MQERLRYAFRKAATKAGEPLSKSKQLVVDLDLLAEETPIKFLDVVRSDVRDFIKDGRNKKWVAKCIEAGSTAVSGDRNRNRGESGTAGRGDRTRVTYESLLLRYWQIEDEKHQVVLDLRQLENDGAAAQ